MAWLCRGQDIDCWRSWKKTLSAFQMGIHCTIAEISLFNSYLNCTSSCHLSVPNRTKNMTMQLKIGYSLTFLLFVLVAIEGVTWGVVSSWHFQTLHLPLSCRCSVNKDADFGESTRGSASTVQDPDETQLKFLTCQEFIRTAIWESTKLKFGPTLKWVMSHVPDVFLNLATFPLCLKLTKVTQTICVMTGSRGCEPLQGEAFGVSRWRQRVPWVSR